MFNRRHMRARAPALAALALAVAAGLSLAACGGAAVHPAAATQAPAVRAVAAPAAPSACSQMAAWGAAAPLQAITADISQVQADAVAISLPAVEGDGAQLAADAATAAASPPPVDPADYTSAMRHYATAGNDMASGDVTDAVPTIGLATADINRVTAALSAQCGVAVPAPAPMHIVIVPTPAAPQQDAWALVSEYYGDITSHDYSGAWALLAPGLTGQTYAQFAAGYNGTGKQDAQEIAETGDTVSYTLTSLNPDSTVQMYAGTATAANGLITAISVQQTSGAAGA